MKITKRPPEIFAAFTPTFLTIAKEVTDTQTSVSIQIKPVRNDSFKEMTLTRDFLNGLATFNISDIVKKLFQDKEIAYSIQIGYSPFIYDYNLCVEFIIVVNDTQIKCTAVNAVEQLTNESGYESKRGRFLTEFDKLIVYEGYPSTVTIQPYKGKTYIKQELLSPIANPQDYPIFSVRLETNNQYISIIGEPFSEALENSNGEVITTNEGEVIDLVLSPAVAEKRKPMETRCVPSNPFYVRWINQMGGWDYWMFSYRQTIERKIKEQKTYNPTTAYKTSISGYTEEYYKEAEEKITVGYEGLTPDEYEWISKLIYSPGIQYYYKGHHKWLDLILDKGETENDTRSTAKDVEFTFFLPNPQLQI